VSPFAFPEERSESSVDFDNSFCALDFGGFGVFIEFKFQIQCEPANLRLLDCWDDGAIFD
jgi:hypothetical protein